MNTKVNLDHGLSEDINKEFALKPRGSKTGRYDTHDPTPKLL